MRPGSLQPVVLVLAACVLAVSGPACGSDDPTPPPPPEYVLPATPDEVILELRGAYTDLRLATIDSLLAPGYSFEFAPIDIDSFQIAPTWGRTEELRSMERMFTGENGRWPTGEPRPPLDIEFPLNPQLNPIEGSAWIEGPPGRFRRSYAIAMIINYVEGIDVVSGTHTFEVMDISTVGGPDGQSASGFAITWWHDSGLVPPPGGRTGGDGVATRALHAASWGYVKASFREID